MRHKGGIPCEGIVIVSDEQRRAPIRVLEAGFQKALVCISEFDVAEETNIVHFTKKSQADLRKALRADTLAAMPGIYVNAFEVRDIIRLGYNVSLEQQLSILYHNENPILFDPSSDAL